MLLENPNETMKVKLDKGFQELNLIGAWKYLRREEEISLLRIHAKISHRW